MQGATQRVVASAQFRQAVMHPPQLQQLVPCANVHRRCNVVIVLPTLPARLVLWSCVSERTA